MTEIRDQITSADNLMWAWQKARKLYRSADGLVDWAAVSAFELDLEHQLSIIASGFRNLTFKLSPLVHDPQPKKPDDEGRRMMRQSFQLSVRDQVAWISVVNILGPTLDSEMPPWSYGHRLYKAAWFEDEPQGVPRLEIGPYRHSSGNLYRRFKHSWPLFRRHISLSARLMVQALNREELDVPEQQALNQPDRPAYFETDYWPGGTSDTLYYASIDLERFYPNVAKTAITHGFHEYCPVYRDDEWLQKLLNRLLDFRVGNKGSKLLNDPIVQPQTKAGLFAGIPTGLMVAGFLSNVALLPVDRFVDRLLGDKHRIAHFRFVDDHAILAYDFDELRAWIAQYEAALLQYEIGPKLSPTKFDPREMADAYRNDAPLNSIAEAKKQATINGRRPHQLMTKTLALVSVLAGTDFDVLSEDSREQRLRELEWLLLADLPDNEIRADTRAAFAAGRLGAALPVAFSPSSELIKAWREVARLKNLPSKEISSGDLDRAQEMANQRQVGELLKYTKRLDHYFKLLLQAFHDHPDKPRLFIRVLDYCRKTGHSGTGELLNWLSVQAKTDKKHLADYLWPLAIQIIARHIATAASDVNNNSLLGRQRLAARSYLRSLYLTGFHSNAFQRLTDLDPSLATSKNCLQAALAYAIDCTAQHSETKVLSDGLRRLGALAKAPLLTSPSAAWSEATNSPIGVWTHWLDGLIGQNVLGPGKVWERTSASHDPANALDWLNLRKGPEHLTAVQATYLSDAGMLSLTKGDGGWLFDQQKSGHPINQDAILRNRPVSRSLHRHIAELSQRHDRITALGWVDFLSTLKEKHDPRASEWTALEILRQLLDRLKEFPGLELATLDHLHPSNLLLPSAWCVEPSSKQSFSGRWTWEAWRAAVRSSNRSITLTRTRLEDYRREPSHSVNLANPQASWAVRLRGCGLLLLGLIAKDFRLPNSWNVRGLERTAAPFVRAVLEEVPISSHTHSIIEASLLPRSAETAMIRANPSLFFGNRTVETINDTKADPPSLPDLEALVTAILGAQKTLENGQLSVLDHAPRQLIPMNVIQLRRAADSVDL